MHKLYTQLQLGESYTYSVILMFGMVPSMLSFSRRQ